MTHDDLDGEGAAAAYLRILSVDPSQARIEFAEPYDVDRALERVAQLAAPGDVVAIMDIGYNDGATPRALRVIVDLVRRGVAVEWYDHHVWAEEELEAVRAAGARIFVDRSTCGAGVVVHYASKLRGLEPDEYLLRLERAVCAADLWRWDDPLAPKLMRASNSGEDERASRWRRAVIESFYRGELWNAQMEARLASYLEAELAGSSRELRSSYRASSGGCSVVAVVRSLELPSDSILASMAISRTESKVAAIVKRRGLGRVSLSLRSRGQADVQVVAKALGGGGHPRASGASMRVPALVYLLSYLYPRLLARYVASKLAALGDSLGACEAEAGEADKSEGLM